MILEITLVHLVHLILVSLQMLMAHFAALYGKVRSQDNLGLLFSTFKLPRLRIEYSVFNSFMVETGY